MGASSQGGLVDGTIELGTAWSRGEAYTGYGYSLGMVAVTTAASFTTDTQAYIRVTRVSLGHFLTDRDVVGGAALQINGYILGDPTGSMPEGGITVADALRTLRNAVGVMEATQEDSIWCGVDGKAGVTVGDALRFLRYAVGLPAVLLIPPDIDCGPE